MADTVLEVEARLKDYISGELNKIGGKFREFSNDTERSTKKVDDTERAMNKLHKRFLGIGAAIITVRYSMRYFTEAAKDAGLTTGKIDQVFADLKQTVGTEILPVFQGVVDTINDNSDAIIKIPTIAVRSLLAVERVATAAVLEASSLIVGGIANAVDLGLGVVNKAIDMIRTSIAKAMLALIEFIEMVKKSQPELFKSVNTSGMASTALKLLPTEGTKIGHESLTFWKNYAAALGQEAKNALDESRIGDILSGEFFKVDIKKGKVKGKEKAGSTTTAESMPSEDPSEDPWMRETAKVFEKFQSQDMKFTSMQVEARKTLLESDMEFTKKQIELSGQRIAQEEKEAQDKKKKSDEDIARRLSELDLEEGVTSSLINLGFTAAAANKKEARDQQRIAAGSALVQGGIATAFAISKAWSGSYNYYEAIAKTVIAIATMAAQTIAITSKINSASFAGGGVVGGNSFSGDRVHANVNSGEMIFNRQQQQNLFNMVVQGSQRQRSSVTVNIQIPAGAAVDMRAADRIESLANVIGDVLQKAEYDGRLERIKPLLVR